MTSHLQLPEGRSRPSGSMPLGSAVRKETADLCLSSSTLEGAPNVSTIQVTHWIQLGQGGSGGAWKAFILLKTSLVILSCSWESRNTEQPASWESIGQAQQQVLFAMRRGTTERGGSLKRRTFSETQTSPRGLICTLSSNRILCATSVCNPHALCPPQQLLLHNCKITGFLLETGNWKRAFIQKFWTCGKPDVNLKKN